MCLRTTRLFQCGQNLCQFAELGTFNGQIKLTLVAPLLGSEVAVLLALLGGTWSVSLDFPIRYLSPEGWSRSAVILSAELCSPILPLPKVIVCVCASVKDRIESH